MFNPIRSFYFRILLTFKIKKKGRGEGKKKIISSIVQFLKLVHSPKVNFCSCEESEENPFSCFRGFRAWKQHLVQKSKIKRNSLCSSESKWVLVSHLWFGVSWAVPWRKVAISALIWRGWNCAANPTKNYGQADRRADENSHLHSQAVQHNLGHGP